MLPPWPQETDHKLWRPGKRKWGGFNGLGHELLGLAGSHVPLATAGHVTPPSCGELGNGTHTAPSLHTFALGFVPLLPCSLHACPLRMGSPVSVEAETVSVLFIIVCLPQAQHRICILEIVIEERDGLVCHVCSWGTL